MARLHYNALKTGSAGSGVALALGASLTSSATSVTFNAALTHSNGTAVPTITGSDYIPLEILDSSGNMTEIVWLTAYTAGATTGTIARGKEGTNGVAHSSGDKIVGGPTAFDLADHGAKVAKDSTVQTLTTGTVTTLTWQTELQDTDGFWTPGASSRFTIPTGLGGKYLVTGNFAFDINVAWDKLAGFTVNGTEVVSARSRDNSPYASLEPRALLTLADGDYVEMIAYQGSGSSQSTSATLALYAFSIQRIA